MCFARRHRRSSTNDVIINDRDNKTHQSIVVTSENRIPIASAVGAVSFVLFCATARFNFVRRFSTSRSPNASLSPPPLSPPPPPPLATTQFRKRRLRRLRRRRRVPSSPRRQRNVLENVKVVIEGEGQRNIKFRRPFLSRKMRDNFSSLDNTQRALTTHTKREDSKCKSS